MFGTAMRKWRALSLVMVLSMVGCGSSASIVRRDGTTTDGRILRSDRYALVLEASSGDQPTRVDRRSIRDVDHPGNVAMVFGTVLLTVVGFYIISSKDFREELVTGDQAGYNGGLARPMTLTFGLPGLGLLGFGAYRYISSKRAAQAPDDVGLLQDRTALGLR
jgi:hypothetical protein